MPNIIVALFAKIASAYENPSKDFLKEVAQDMTKLFFSEIKKAHSAKDVIDTIVGFILNLPGSLAKEIKEEFAEAFLKGASDDADDTVPTLSKEDHQLLTDAVRALI